MSKEWHHYILGVWYENRWVLTYIHRLDTFPDIAFFLLIRFLFISLRLSAQLYLHQAGIGLWSVYINCRTLSWYEKMPNCGKFWRSILEKTKHNVLCGVSQWQDSVLRPWYSRGYQVHKLPSRFIGMFFLTIRLHSLQINLECIKT